MSFLLEAKLKALWFPQTVVSHGQELVQNLSGSNYVKASLHPKRNQI